MKDEIMNRLAAVLNALNAVSVNGKQNLANLSGIAVIEEVAAMLGEASIEKASAADGEKKK